MSTMLTKFETKSNRVKGIAFHPKRPWVLASLHNGVIQLWEYRMGTLLERYDEHEGPVRGVHFHPTQPLFVSGADDYKIKLWNYKLRRCVFTFLGHLDYIRTVKFHHEQPWIVSASDDQTIRIWNWQSRQCISVLTGHNHYVMSAEFHPKDDLIVSASLDQTVRVWDISALHKKSPMRSDDVLKVPSLNNDFFGTNDAMVKYILEGHERGVNWAAFHPTLPLIASGADDRQIKLWRMNETKAWEVDTLRGHLNNVSCVIFHPRQELIISNSEDKSIRVWDISKRVVLHTYRREHDRFWVLTAHPTENLLAAGHDSGLIVFKLERERPAFCTSRRQTLYIKDRAIRAFDFQTTRDDPVVQVRRGGNANAGDFSDMKYRTMTYNAAENAVLITSVREQDRYELYILPKEGSTGAGASSGAADDAVRRGNGCWAVFIARNRFVVMDKFRQLTIYNLKNEMVKKLPPPTANVDAMFPAGTGTVLLRADEKVLLYDVQQRKTVAEIPCPLVKYVVWSEDGDRVALLSKHGIVIASKRLDHICTVHETIRVKSGAFNEQNMFVYSTLNHVKYCLPNGDSGIIRTLEAPIYITRVKGNAVFFIDREGRNSILYVDATEYKFKLALYERNYTDIMKMVKSSRLVGDAIISYLQQKGYPEVALQFVQDERTRFNLALECGLVQEVALPAARQLDDESCWTQLAVEALRQGNHEVVEMAFQRVKDFERLSFLYLMTGNGEKLRKMLKIAELRQDVMSRFHNALYLGDVRARIAILEETGQLALAYLAAQTHGLAEDAERLKQLWFTANPNAKIPGAEESATGGDESSPEVEPLGRPELPTIDPDQAELLVPPTPIVHECNWPLLSISKGIFETVFAERGALDISVEDEAAASAGAAAGAAAGSGSAGASGGAGWDSESARILDDGDVDDILGGGDAAGAGFGESGGLGGGDDVLGGGGGWEDADMDLPDLDGAIGGAGLGAGLGAGGGDTANIFVAPQPGVPVEQRWTDVSPLAVDHIAAGSFDTAMQLLRKQIGAVNLKPLRTVFIRTYLAAHGVFTTLPGLNPATHALERNWTETANRSPQSLPVVAVTLTVLIDRLKVAYKATTDGRFVDAVALFTGILHAIPLLVVESKAEVAEVKELLGICRDYINALRIELRRKDLKEDQPQRNCELAAYFTHCNIQPVHLMLALRSAMLVAYKIKNVKTAASFARRLLELNPKPEVAQQAKKVVQVADQAGAAGKDALPLQYDERNPFVVCGVSHTPILKGTDHTRCPYCSQPFHLRYKNYLCNVCQISKIGADVTGLRVSIAQR